MAEEIDAKVDPGESGSWEFFARLVFVSGERCVTAFSLLSKPLQMVQVIWRFFHEIEHFQMQMADFHFAEVRLRKLSVSFSSVTQCWGMKLANGFPQTWWTAVLRWFDLVIHWCSPLFGGLVYDSNKLYNHIIHQNHQNHHGCTEWSRYFSLGKTCTRMQ